MQESCPKSTYLPILITLLLPLFSLFYLQTTHAQNPILSLDYFSLVQQKVSSYIYYPAEAQTNGWQGTVKLKLTLSKDGTVNIIDVIESSGYTLLDDSAILAVTNASPFPFPSDYTGQEEIEIVLPIRFEPEGTETSSTLSETIDKIRDNGKDSTQEIQPPPLEQPPLIKESEAEKPVSDKLKKEKFNMKDNRQITNDTGIKELFDIAKKRSHPLKIAESQITLAKIKIEEPLRNLFPNLGLEYSSSKGESITDPVRRKSYGLKAQHTLFDSGQRNYALKREKINVEVAQENYNTVKNEIVFELLKNYYVHQKEKTTLTLLSESQKKFEDYFNTGIMLKQGNLITQIEFLKIQNIYNKVEAEIVAQQSRYNLSIANLKKVIDIEPEEELPAFSTIEFKEDIIFDSENALISEYIKKGLKLRPEIASYEKTKEATELGYKTAKVENRPKFIMESFWGKSGEALGEQPLDLLNTFQIFGKVVWLWGGSSFETGVNREKTVPTAFTPVSQTTSADTLSLKFSLLDKLRYYAETQEGKVAMKQVDDEITKLKKDIAWDVQEGFFSYTEAQKRVGSVKKELETYLKEFELKEELLKASELELSDLMETRLRVLEIEQSLLKAKLDMYLGIITLEKATGFNLDLIKEL